MTNDLGSGIHFFSKGKKPEEVTSKERENAKRVVYGILYGMGESSIYL
jgi:DNA polymerase I-like protein with 3'-5' exonuclease and polymerase domains